MQLRTERLLARHGWQTAFQNRAVRGLLLFMGLLVVYAAVTGWMTFREQNDLRAAYQREARQDWLDNPDKNPHRMAHYGHFAFRPKAPLSVFDFGMESFLGNTIFLEAHRQNSVNFSEAGFSTGLLRFGEISMAMVLQVLLPLLIFFLGFGSVATDRENGTLRLILSQGVSWQQLLAGRSLGLIGVMLTLFVPVVEVMGTLWLVLQPQSLTLDETGRLLLLIGAYLGYLIIFCVGAVLVSAVSRTAKTALVTLIGIWLMSTMVLPRASQALGSALYPAPSKVKFFAAIEEAILKEGDSHNPGDPHYKALKDSLLIAYGVDSVQQLPINYSGFVMAEGEKISATIYNRHFADLLAIYARQNRFARAVAFIDPYMAIKNGSMALSGTDYASYIDFQRQAEQYRYNMAQKMNGLQINYISNRKPGPTDKPLLVDKTHWNDVPDFVYTPPGLAKVLTQNAGSLLAVGCWLLVLGYAIRVLSKTLTAF